MPNSVLKIKKAIDSGNIQFLTACTEEELKNFKFASMGAFLYACHAASFETIKFIIDRMGAYLENEKNYEHIEDKEEREETMDEEYCDFFYEQGLSVTEGGKPYSAPVILLNRDDGYEIFKYADDLLNFFESDELLKAIASPRGSSFEGYIKDNILPAYIKDLLRMREYRSFPGERERQLMKQFSTILFFEIQGRLSKDEKKSLVEVQTMHLRIGQNSYLFVASNKASVSNKLGSDIKDFQEIKTILTNKNRPIKGDPEGRIRVKRYSKNFDEIIYNEKVKYLLKDEKEVKDQEVKDKTEFNNIRSFLNKDGFTAQIKLSYQDNEIQAEAIKAILTKNEPVIVFIDTSGCKNAYKGRHAEEFLIDIAEVAQKLAEALSKDFHICIAGKKRPCITCYGRMSDFANKLSELNELNGKKTNGIEYGRNPGLIWSGALQIQSKRVREESIKAFVQIGSSVTCVMRKDKLKMSTDYDSGTDEEEEEGYRQSVVAVHTR